jgi:hypothetical protein
MTDGGQDRAHALGWGKASTPADLRPSPATPLHHRKLQVFQKVDKACVQLCYPELVEELDKLTVAAFLLVLFIHFLLLLDDLRNILRS